MCGRYTIIAKAEEIEKRFKIEVPETYTSNFNAAPTQILPVITNQRPEGLSFFKWGLIPGWAKDPGIGAKLINARSETIAEKASFKNALKHRRCLVIANGFYEWKKSSKKSKIPYHIYLPKKALFAFAGLWETYTNEEETPIHTFTIITTKASEKVSNIHERMPVILNQETEMQWLSRENDTTELLALLKPDPDLHLDFHPVSHLVNSVANNNSQLIEPSQPVDQRGNLTLFD